MATTVHHTVCPACNDASIKLHLEGKDFSISQEAYSIWKCDACNFVFTQNIPSMQDIGAYYQAENYVSHSNTQKGWFFRLYHIARTFMLASKKKLVNKHLPTKGKLVDIGCGTGYFLNEMKKDGWDTLGLEPSDAARNLAIEQFQLTIEDKSHLYQLPAKSADVVTMWHVLEHVHNLQEDIAQIRKITKGILVVAVPNHDSYDGKHYGKHWAGWDVPRHLWHFTPATMQQIMQKQGFELLTTYRMPLDSFYVSLLSEKYAENSLGTIRGAWNGGVSWLNSMFNKNNCSSVIYVFK